MEKNGRPYIRTSLASHRPCSRLKHSHNKKWKREQGLCDVRLVLIYGWPCFFHVIPTYEPLPWFMILLIIFIIIIRYINVHIYKERKNNKQANKQGKNQP